MKARGYDKFLKSIVLAGTPSDTYKMSPSKSINHKPLLSDLVKLLGHYGVPQTHLHLQLASHHALPFIHQLQGKVLKWH